MNRLIIPGRKFAMFLVLALSGLPAFCQSKTSTSVTYCTKVFVHDSVELSVYAPTMFRFRVSHLKGERFPANYEIPFVIGKTTPWKQVSVSKYEDTFFTYVKTEQLLIKIAKSDASWTVWNRNGDRKIYPSDGPQFGMFKDGYTLFDNASAFHETNKNSRYSHWFFNANTKRYTDVYLEEDLIEDQYFIYGPSYASIFSQYNELVGPEPLLPKKGYGFFQTQHLACEGNQQQVMEVVKMFREKNIPLDNLILDFEWGDGCDGGKEITWGSSLNWSSNYSTPLTPEQMIQKLKEQHVDVMLIHHSAPDFKNRKHQGWTETVYDEEKWNKAYLQKLDMGIVGTWQDTRINDITDSYIWNLTEKHKPGERVLFLGCRKTVALNPWDFRYSVVPVENMIGARRYPFHWTEDASSSWNELKFQLKATNNTFGPLQGYSYLNSDGVAGNWRMQARWNQFTTMSAIARSHNPKPWSGNIDVFDFTNKIRITGRDTIKLTTKPALVQTETAEESVRKYLNLRYRLLPFIYSYAHVNYHTGMPIVRPMLLAFPNDYICASDTWPYQYMLGNELLIAPVYGDFRTMEIYLPQGNNWIDYNTGEIYKNGGVITYDVSDVTVMPMFIREGSIIPMRQLTQWIDPTKTDDLTLEIFPSDTVSTFSLFEDDGVTTRYQSGELSKTMITTESNFSKNEIVVKISAMEGEFTGKPQQRVYTVVVNKMYDRPDVYFHGKLVSAGVQGNKEIQYGYDATQGKLTIQVDKSTKKQEAIVIRWK